MGDRAGQGRAGSGGVYGRTMTAPASPSSWDLPSTDKAPFINACSSLPPQIPEGASLAMSLTDKKDTTLSRGNSSFSLLLMARQECLHCQRVLSG